MAIETYQYALKVTLRHERTFARWAGCRRWVWNHLLKNEIEPIAKARSEERTGQATIRYPSAFDLQKRIVALKREYPWLSQPPSHALQQAAADLSDALLAVRSGAGFPSFKRKGRCSDSFRENDPRCFAIDQRNSRIMVPKLGWVRYHNSRHFEGTPKTLTIIRKGNRWFASIQVELPEPVATPAHPHAESAVGIDRGVAVFAALSDGTHIAPVSPLKATARELRTAQRALSRKQRGSKNWRRAAHRVQRIHRKVADIRRDFLHKTSTTIAQNHGVVILEKLEVQSMVASAKGTKGQPGKNVKAKAGLNRAILDQGWYAFEQMLAYKLAKRGGHLLHVPAAYTSQRCFTCGQTAAENRRSQAVFHCVSCGHAENADTNAARNIKRAGQALLGAPQGEHQPQQRRAQKPPRRRMSSRGSCPRLESQSPGLGGCQNR
jgi:putative transposase